MIMILLILYIVKFLSVREVRFLACRDKVSSSLVVEGHQKKTNRLFCLGFSGRYVMLSSRLQWEQECFRIVVTESFCFVDRQWRLSLYNTGAPTL
jgi:hypothetical protein